MRMKLTEVKKLTSVWFRFSLLIINSINENLHCSNFFFVWVFHFLMPSSSLDSNSSSDHYWIKSNLTFDCVCFFFRFISAQFMPSFFFLCPFLIPPIILNFISQFFFSWSILYCTFNDLEYIYRYLNTWLLFSFLKIFQS